AGDPGQGRDAAAQPWRAAAPASRAAAAAAAALQDRGQPGSGPYADARGPAGRTRRRVRVVSLPGRPEDAVRVALLSHGWEGELCRTTADGLESLAFHLTHLEPVTLEAL